VTGEWGAAVLDRIADALVGRQRRVTRRSSSQLRAECPSHADRNASLVVTVRDGRVLLRCFGGCRTERVIDDLGFTWVDLHDNEAAHARSSGPQQVVDAYDYATADGVVYARKKRYGPIKKFAWERRDLIAPSGWRPGLLGRKPGLFGLEDVQDVREVLITEGEKAARLLRERGFAAVAPPCGANVWEDEFTASLWRAGVCRAVVLPDEDKPGNKHATKVAEVCAAWRPTLPLASPPGDPAPEVTLAPEDPEAAPLVVRLLRLPDLRAGEDVYDWLTVHGHTADDLRASLASALNWTPDDPVERRRALTRKRVSKYRARKRAERESQQGAAGQR
jgi:hypothetical protein